MKQLLCSLVLIGAFASYTESGFGYIKIGSYGLSAFSLIGVFILSRQPLRFNRGGLVLLFSGLFFLTSFVSLVTAPEALLDYRTTILTFSYPIFFALTVLVGYSIFESPLRLVRSVIIALGILNGLFGVFESLFGISARSFFGTSFSAASGLTLNVNYFSTTQISLFFMYAFTRNNDRVSSKKIDIFFLAFLVLTGLLGSSRGILLALLASIVILLLIQVIGSREGGRFFATIVICLVSVLSIALFTVWYEWSYNAFRLYKGDNSRLDIWAAALAAWSDRPLFGWGLTAGHILGEFSGGMHEGRSAHSAYLSTLIRTGLVGFVSVYGLILYVFFLIVRFPSEVWYRLRWYIAGISFYLIASLFRTYSLGGLGLLPILGTASVSCILFQLSSLRSQCRYQRFRGKQRNLERSFG